MEEVHESESNSDYMNYCSALRKATRGTFEKVLDGRKQDPKYFCSYIRSMTKTEDKVGLLKDEDGNTVAYDSVAADILNKFFSSVFTTEVIDNLSNTNQFFTCSLGERLLYILMLPEATLSKLSNLKPDKAPGLDQMSPQLLRVSEQTCTPLCTIFRSSL